MLGIALANQRSVSVRHILEFKENLRVLLISSLFILLAARLTMEDVRYAVIDGAVLRVRPIMMTVAAIIAGLLPIMLGSGTGSEVMRRIAAPMVGGIVSATLLTLVVIPAVYLLWKRAAIVRENRRRALGEPVALQP